MQTFIVVLEYSGAALLGDASVSRAAICEHAYDLGTGNLAGHRAEDSPRVRFPVCQRSWNSPPQAPRCPCCDTVVQRIVRSLIAATFRSIVSRYQASTPVPQALTGKEFYMIEHATSGQESLAKLATEHNCQPSAILRLTAEHSPGSAYPGNVSAYINGVFHGTIPVTSSMPAGLHLYLPQ